MHAAHPLAARVVERFHVHAEVGAARRHVVRREQLLGPRLLRPARRRRNRRDAQPDLRVWEVGTALTGATSAAARAGVALSATRLAQRLQSRRPLRRVQPPPLVVEGGRQHPCTYAYTPGSSDARGPATFGWSHRVPPSSSGSGQPRQQAATRRREVLVRLRQPPRAVGGVLRAALERLGGCPRGVGTSSKKAPCSRRRRSTRCAARRAPTASRQASYLASISPSSAPRPGPAAVGTPIAGLVSAARSAPG